MKLSIAVLALVGAVVVGAKEHGNPSKGLKAYVDDDGYVVFE